MLELKNLAKHYDLVPAVKNLDLTIRPGEIDGYRGPNASGKSTKLRCQPGCPYPIRHDRLAILSCW
jgi:ABC-type multidrug transport system ATPase subunit